MIVDTIKDKLARTPFEPFVIRTSSGEGYTVAATDLVVLMKSKVFVAEPKSDRAATISYPHITAVEDPGGGRRGGAAPGRPRTKR